MQQECWTIDPLDTYKSTRRMAAIYNANGQDKKKAIEIFCQEAGYTQKKAEEYLAEAIGIRARQTEGIIDRDENDIAIVEDIATDGKAALHHAVYNHWRGKEIRASLEKLPWREQTILKARNAICSNCGGMMPMEKRFRFKEIGIKIMNGASDKGAEIAYHAALDQLAVQLIEDGTCRIVDLVLKYQEQTENKKAAATYLYRVDCDGEWGEICFDFENKRIKIQKLAEWDTTKSHQYAWKVIGFIAPKGTKMLPEKKRIVLWDKHIGQKKKAVRLQDGSVIYLPLPR